MHKLMITVGIPGVGKSTLLKELVKQRPDVTWMNYGTEIIKVAALEGIDRDDLRRMPVDEQLENGLKAARAMVEKAKGVTIVDTHALYRTPMGFVPGIRREVLHVFQPKAIAFVECSPEIIAERRGSDSSRNRDEETVEELTLHQSLVRSYCTAASMETGCALMRIDNGPHAIGETVKPLISLVDQLGAP